MMEFNPSGRDRDISLKLRAHNLQNARDQTKQLESESRKMEERLQELKLVMTREKQDRERAQAGFWKSGQLGNLSSYGKQAVEKQRTAVKVKKAKKAVKVLKDEPIALPERANGPGTFGYIAQRGQGSAQGKENRTKKGPKCGQCEEKGAQVSCLECGEDYCAGCFASFHVRGALKKHRSVPFGSAGARTPRGYAPQPGRGTTTTSRLAQGDDGRGPQEKKSVQFEDNSPASSPPHRDHGVDQASLLHGAYDEGDSAAAFQEALRAWRTGSPGAPATAPRRVSPVRAPGPVVNMEHGTSTADLVHETATPNIKFHGGLTYAEKLLLKKHRRATADECGLRSPVSQESEAYHGQPRSPATARDNESRCDEIEETPVELLPGYEDAEDEGRIHFRSLHRAMRRDGDGDGDRPQSSLSIIELEDSPVTPTRWSRSSEVTSSYHVTEAREEDVAKYIRDTVQRADPHTPLTTSVMSRASPSAKRRGHVTPTPIGAPALGANLHNNGQSTHPKQAKAVQNPKQSTLTTKIERPDSSARSSSRTHSKATSRPPSRSGARPKSRAQCRLELFGESHITMTPSEALREIASRSHPRLAENHALTATLGDFFTAGAEAESVLRTEPALGGDGPERALTPTILRPSQPRDTGPTGAGDKWAVSNKLYRLGPRAWRPDSALEGIVPHQLASQQLADVTQHLHAAQHGATNGQDQHYVMSWTLSASLADQKATGIRSTVDTSPHEARSNTSTPEALTDTGRTSTDRSARGQRPQTADGSPCSGRQSRMIEVDGDDLSGFDGADTVREEEREDAETLEQLEWELASQDGRLTADTRCFRVASPIQTTTSPPPRSPSPQQHVSASQTSQDMEFDDRLRASVLMRDFEEMEQQIMAEEEDDIKALT